MTKKQQRLFREDWFLPEAHVPAAGPACALGAAACSLPQGCPWSSEQIPVGFCSCTPKTAKTRWNGVITWSWYLLLLPPYGLWKNRRGNTCCAPVWWVTEARPPAAVPSGLAVTWGEMWTAATLLSKSRVASLREGQTFLQLLKNQLRTAHGHCLHSLKPASKQLLCH